MFTINYSLFVRQKLKFTLKSRFFKLSVVIKNAVVLKKTIKSYDVIPIVGVGFKENWHWKFRYLFFLTV